MREIDLEDFAVSDLASTREFYNELRPSWGDHIMTLVDQEIHQLASLDILNHPIFYTFHRLICRKAKQSIYYRKTSDRINVAAVLDQRFSPKRIKATLLSRN